MTVCPLPSDLQIEPIRPLAIIYYPTKLHTEAFITFSCVLLTYYMCWQSKVCIFFKSDFNSWLWVWLHLVVPKFELTMNNVFPPMVLWHTEPLSHLLSTHTIFILPNMKCKEFQWKTPTVLLPPSSCLLVINQWTTHMRISGCISVIKSQICR